MVVTDPFFISIFLVPAALLTVIILLKVDYTLLKKQPDPRSRLSALLIVSTFIFSVSAAANGFALIYVFHHTPLTANGPLIPLLLLTYAAIITAQIRAHYPETFQRIRKILPL